MFDEPTLAIDHWTWTIAKGVALGQLIVVALGVFVFLVGPWVHGQTIRWRRRWQWSNRGAVSLRLVLLILLPFAAGILIATKAGDWFAGLFGGPPPEIVHADPATIEKARVDPTPGLLERIQMGRVQPTQVRIGTAPSAAGKKRVADYCQPVAVGQLVQTSADRPSSHIPLVTPSRVSPPRLPDFQGRVSGNKVFLSSTLNDGTPWDAKYKVHGHWTFASSDTSVDVRSERFWSRFVRGALRCGAVAGVGGGLGFLTEEKPGRGAARGAAFAGGTCAVLEIAF